MLNRGSSLVVCLGLAVSAGAFAQQYKIATFAGNGTAGYADGSDLTAVQFDSPGAIALDSKGALYIADTVGERIRMISAGSATTIGGTGTQGGVTGTGSGAATSTNISDPGGIVVASDGTVYFAETSGNVVRKISGGNINPVAGDGNQGNLGDNGGAAFAEFNGPTGLALDSAGNLYISDTQNSLVHRIDAKTGIIINYIGGTGPTNNSIVHQTGICFDSSGALYIADTGNQRIARYANGQLTTFAGNGTRGFAGDGGLATKAQLSSPVGLATDAAGNLYIADSNNSRIRKVTPDGYIYTIAGSSSIGYTGDGGPATSAALNFPRGLAVAPDGTIYIADTANNVIRVLTPTQATAIAGAVTNAASFAQRISPGAWATVFGSGFGSSTVNGSLGLLSNALPTTLNSIQVTVNGTPAPLLFVSPGQINFQVPWAATPNSSGNAAVTVVINGGPTNVIQVPLSTAAPGIFTNGAAAIAQNYPDYSLNDASHPVPAGGTIIVYLTGSGPLSGSVPNGTPSPASPLLSLTASISAKLGSSNAAISFAGMTPNFVGLVQFNITVPQALASGTYPLTVTIDGQTSNAGN
ncbi:MAG: SMP-30/gluconolactonase/LRE family protein, partial [Acidobacteriota bacterium]|nr:SMP-30/gluconolactonase/LRE family protein [Acidobacteriota bacterium]